MPMIEPQIQPEIETLARMAASLAGHDPDRHVTVQLGKVVAFDDVAWRYPDFIKRAQAAYTELQSTLRGDA